jgi:hypothetical protein
LDVDAFIDFLERGIKNFEKRKAAPGKPFNPAANLQ